VLQTNSLLQDLWVHKTGVDIQVASVSGRVHVTAHLTPEY